LQKAVTFLLKAAKQDDSEAQKYLGDIYIQDDFVNKNFDQTIYWYRKAAGNGSVSSINVIRELSNSGKIQVS